MPMLYLPDAPIATAPSTIKKDPQAIINEAVNSISHIATLPEITIKIIELVDNPRSTAQDLNKEPQHWRPEEGLPPSKRRMQS